MDCISSLLCKWNFKVFCWENYYKKLSFHRTLNLCFAMGFAGHWCGCVFYYTATKKKLFLEMNPILIIYQSHRQNRWNQNTRENNLWENLPIAILVDDSITYAVVTVSIYIWCSNNNHSSYIWCLNTRKDTFITNLIMFWV